MERIPPRRAVCIPMKLTYCAKIVYIVQKIYCSKTIFTMLLLRLRTTIRTMCYRCPRSRQWKSQHRRQWDYRTGIGLTSVRCHGGRSRVHGHVGRAYQSRFRDAIPVRVPFGRRLAVLVALGKRVQRIPVDG